MSKLKVQDFEYYYPRDLLAQAKVEGKFPQELMDQNLTFLIRKGDKILTSKNSKISHKFAKELVSRYKEAIEVCNVGEVLNIRFQNIDIDAINKNGKIIIRYTCQVFTWDNLIDVVNDI